MVELQRLNLDLQVMRSTRATSAAPVAHGWQLELSSGAIQNYNKVFIAAGFGKEAGIGAAAAQAYWSAAGPPLPLGANPRTLISGVGDGGLTDALALLVRDFEHRRFTECFLRLARAEVLAEAVNAAEQAAMAVGDSDLTPHYQAHVDPALEAWGVLNALKPALRRDRRLVLNSETGPLLLRSAASRLNQLMLFAVSRAVTEQDPLHFAHSSGRINDVRNVNERYIVLGPILQTGVAVGEVDHVIIRHGPCRSAHFTWLGGRFEDFKAHREALVSCPANID